jgi:phage integrase
VLNFRKTRVYTPHVKQFTFNSKILDYENMNVTIEVYTHQLKELEEASNSEVREIFANLRANLGRNTSNTK